MPNPTSSPESGVPTGSDPPRGPPAWAGLPVDAGAACPPCCVTRCTCLVLGRRWCSPPTLLCDSLHMSGFGETLVHGYGRRDEGASEAEGTVDRHAVVNETRGKRGRFTSEKKRWE